MSILSTDQIKECIDTNILGHPIKWKNNQEYILCIECEKTTDRKNISMLYKCDSIDSYTLYSVCINCIKNHLTKIDVKRNHDIIQSIKKENRNQKAIIESTGISVSKNPFTIAFNTDH